VVCCRVFAARATRIFLILAVAAVYLVTFSTWYYWRGGTNWGPRFLVPLLPFLVLLSAPVVERVLSLQHFSSEGLGVRAAFAVTFTFLCLVSFGIELLGVSLDSLTYRVHMLNVSQNPEADAIFMPSASPLIGYLPILKPKNLDLAWIRTTGDHVNVDWLVVILTLGVIVFCGMMLARVLRGRPSSRVALGATIPFVVALTFLTLYRVRDDPRFGGNAGYAALLETVQREAQPRDVLLLDDDALAPFFLNENRAALRWYGLSRDPAPGSRNPCLRCSNMNFRTQFI
jgi:hypothetical protein